MVNVKEKIKRYRSRKFRRAAEASLLRVITARDLLVCAVDQLSINFSLARTARRRARQGGHDLIPALADFRVVFFPGVCDPAQHLEKARLPVAILRWKIGAANKWLECGGKPNVEWPAPATCRCLDKSHVDAIDIWPLFAVDLDADEARIEKRGDLLVFERLAFHHVTPVASGIAD